MRVSTDMPLEVVVDVVNEWGDAPRRAADEEQQAYPSFQAVTAARGWEAPRSWRPALTDEQLARAADELFAVFAADRPETVARRLNDLAERLRLRPQLTVTEEDGYAAAIRVERAEDALLAAAVGALAAYLTGRDEPRLGVCTGARCVDVYVDLSPGRRRRFCSLTCQNRNRVAAFRARRAGASGQRG
jgi:predicted RNA-binding Zn ribbon-like protein